MGDPDPCRKSAKGKKAQARFRNVESSVFQMRTLTDGNCPARDAKTQRHIVAR
ncbi:hypothetical protein WAI453_001886 [Rhynchosporium graminicola]